MKAVNATASFVLAVLLALTAALVVAAGVGASPPSLMSPGERLAALAEIERSGRIEISRCRDVEEPADRAICRARVRAMERVSIATLEARYRGTVNARESVRHVQARAAHSMGMALRLVAS